MNACAFRELMTSRRFEMTDKKKKGDFNQWEREDKGGNKKAHEHADNSRTADKQNTGTGGRNP